MTTRTLLLAPSRGLGGGIERYVETVQSSLRDEGIECRRLDLHSSQPASRARHHSMFLKEAWSDLRSHPVPTQVVVAHRNLLPTALLVARQPHVRGVSLICHGTDVWAAGRRWIRPLMRRPKVRLVAVSAFSAGALLGTRSATVLPPGLARDWYDTLVRARARAQPVEPGLNIVTAFRLRQWESKGLPELLEAVERLGRRDVTVTVCGIGPIPSGLGDLADSGQCRVRADLTDDELADALAQADVFVLATRLRTDTPPSGEGFGLVLIEAQIAGTPVVAPAYGGGHDAFLEGLTGLSPSDESAESLASVLVELIDHPARRAELAAEAARWASRQFDPASYAPLAARRLL